MREMVNKDQVAGVAKQVKGSVKEAAGKATGNRRTQAEGTADKIAGKVQKAYGDVKDKVKKAL
ncbi:CsbD family protein [Mesorhizobium sp.]|uniref:CsbD family protein n=1 Tax=Mesorhizobium sp. TaxID=1871066 RepID=UPI0025BD7AAF|nr:CsbD family protein [Mesorhizobium sp.]